MQIQVVQPGQTLTAIAQAYGTTADAIASANELQGLPYLVVGQALVIPIVGQFHIVQPGETLYSLARTYGTTPAALAQVNRLTAQSPLPVGLRLYIPPTPRRSAEVNAYIEPEGETYSSALLTDLRRAAPQLTYLAPFSFRAQRDGTLQAPPLEGPLEVARQQRVTPILAVTNLEGGRFSADLAKAILESESVQDRLLDNILAEAQRLGFPDIHFDFEFLPPESRDAYNRFLRKAADRIHAAGLMISTALAPKTGAEQRGQWYEAHDYRAHGEIVDFAVLMTYEWGYSGGPPRAVSPLPNVREVLDYAVTEMPPGKIMMGQNLYGYDWRLPYVPGGQIAQALSPQQAIRLAADRGAAIQYDYQAQAPFFDYYDDERRQHRVWFEDARSIAAKISLVEAMGLRGISYWKLGFDFPQNWLLLQDRFAITKLQGS